MFWAGAGFWAIQFNSAGGASGFDDQLQISNPAADRLLFSAAVDTEFTFNTANGFSIGNQTGANGNQFGNIVTGNLIPATAGDYVGILLTHSENYDNNNLSRGRVTAWVINGFSYDGSTGTITESDTLTIGGMVTSAPGITITERQSLNVIGGRSKLSTVMQYSPINPTALTSGNNNNWAGLLTGSANNAMRHWARIQGNATTSVITGISATAAQDGDTFELTNVSANAIDITDQDVASAVANRVITPSGVTYVLAADETVIVRYDSTTARWRLLAGTGA